MASLVDNRLTLPFLLSAFLACGVLLVRSLCQYSSFTLGSPIPEPEPELPSTPPSFKQPPPLCEERSTPTMPIPTPIAPPVAKKIKQPLDALLVLDVEATCVQGSGFDWPNEIIEWPVVLLKWSDKDRKGRASKLVVIDEFRSLVRPTWNTQLSDFCTLLTGIQQSDVDSAPTFPAVLQNFQWFLAKHGLIDPITGVRLKKFAFCTDGPFDVRDFVVKQCFISRIPMPQWLQGDVLDARLSTCQWLAQTSPKISPYHLRALNIATQLHVLSLPPFVGRHHSGIDDARNIARVVTELARKSIRLEPNTPIQPRRRWYWMGANGQVIL